MADLSAFHDLLFPTAVSFGATGGPERRNEIVTMVSGRERRNARLSQSRRRYDAGTGLRSLADLQQVIAFFEARRGSLHAFRFRDPFERKSCADDAEPSPTDQALGTGDGATLVFPLVKTYGAGEDAYERLIARPVGGTVRVAVDGVEQLSPGDFGVVDGAVVFEAGSAPGEGAAVTAGYEFDVPVRFDIEHLSVCLTAFKAGQIPSIPLIEVMS